MTTATMPAQNNGHKRPSLADQITRLDRTLDGLADGLNDAVADAVRSAVGEAVRVAVREVLTEVVSNPQVLAKLRDLLVPMASKAEAAPPKPSPWQRLRKLCQHVRTCVVGMLMAGGLQVQHLQTATGHVCQLGIACLTKLASPLRTILRFRAEFIVAMTVGVTLAVSVWYAGPWLAAVSSGIGGFATTLVGLFQRKMVAGNGEQLA